MGDNAEDPIDHHRTTRAHAGQNMKNTAAMPGLVFVGSACSPSFLPWPRWQTGTTTPPRSASVWPLRQR